MKINSKIPNLIWKLKKLTLQSKKMVSICIQVRSMIKSVKITKLMNISHPRIKVKLFDSVTDAQNQICKKPISIK